MDIITILGLVKVNCQHEKVLKVKILKSNWPKRGHVIEILAFDWPKMITRPED